MKTDSVARFEAMLKRAKQIPYSGRPEHKGLVLKDELIAVLEAGLVPPEAESKSCMGKSVAMVQCPKCGKEHIPQPYVNGPYECVNIFCSCGHSWSSCVLREQGQYGKSDTITISRDMATRWSMTPFDTAMVTRMLDEVKKALSEGGVK